ncbi:sigma-E factor negative regulatory protein [Photobacterium sp. TLY01]|uniref:sigma-E factor negative regulatory protein n=1 Tax=Photobacterium sp. TLY01 TaxID=2907534 RepID=UPI001F1A2062|nr:sigma-E factor negative regulatory protein [Photobacterium sp. TLY01]UIP28412.1 sigma-E factor negative regulatory protein [Photobacterium sp. TLY01]
MADKEKISALLDGEDVDQSIINQLLVDDHAKQSWQAYQLMSDVMHGEAPGHPKWDIAGKVAMALENEPAHSLADAGSVVAANVVSLPQVEQPKPHQARRTLPAWLTQFGQVALAACVSLAVIVGVQQYNGGEEAGFASDANTQVPVLQTIPFAGTAEPVSLTRDSVRTRTESPSEAQLMEQRRRINAMLQDYELQLRLNAEDGSLDRTLLESH